MKKDCHSLIIITICIRGFYLGIGSSSLYSYPSPLTRIVFVSIKYHQEKERNLVLTFVTFLSDVLTKSYRFILKQIIILPPGQVSSQRRPEPSSLSNTLLSNVANRSSSNWKVGKSSGSQTFISGIFYIHKNEDSKELLFMWFYLSIFAIL